MILLYSHFLSPHPIPAFEVSTQMTASFLESQELGEGQRLLSRRQPWLPGSPESSESCRLLSLVLRNTEGLGTGDKQGPRACIEGTQGTWTSLAATENQAS